jgi:hypothetical protein
MCHDVEKKVDGSTPGATGTLCENCLGQAALGREEQERLDSNHCEKRAMVRKMRPSTVLGREEIAVCL